MNKHWNCRPRFWKILPIVIAGIAALGFIVMSLWNWLLPSLFTGAHQINYWQALGLFVLCKLLFGGWRGRGDWHDRRHRWEQMSEEERKKFKEGMRGFGRFGRRRQRDKVDTQEQPPSSGSV